MPEVSTNVCAIGVEEGTSEKHILFIDSERNRWYVTNEINSILGKGKQLIGSDSSVRPL